MNFFTKNRILVGTVILLAAINLAILGTIGFHFLNEKQAVEGVAQRPNNYRMMTNELNLTPEQEKMFQNLRQEHSQQTREIRNKLSEHYRFMMRELGSPNPDRTLLDSMANEIALLHKSQQQATIDHFLKVREFCSPEQYQQLHRLFKRMMSRDNMQRGERMQRRPRFERRRFIDTKDTQE